MNILESLEEYSRFVSIELGDKLVDKINASDEVTLHKVSKIISDDYFSFLRNPSKDLFSKSIKSCASKVIDILNESNVSELTVFLNSLHDGGEINEEI